MRPRLRIQLLRSQVHLFSTSSIVRQFVNAMLSPFFLQDGDQDKTQQTESDDRIGKIKIQNTFSSILFFAFCLQTLIYNLHIKTQAQLASSAIFCL